MAEIKDNQFVFIDEEGKETLCEVLFTYDSEEFGKSYVFFVEVGQTDENGNQVVGVSSYNPTEQGFDELEPVEQEEEWEMLEEVFQSFIEDCDGCTEEDCSKCPYAE